MKMNDITSCRNAHHQQHQRRYSCQILLFVLISSSAISEVFSFNTCRTHYKKRMLRKYLENNRNEGKNNFPHSRYGLLLSKVSTEDAYVDNNPTNIVDSKSTSSSSLSTTTNTNIVFPGGGIFFYHQAGVVNFLREEGYDLSICTFSGASAGALTATLTATNVDFYVATDLALKMAEEAGVWDRSNGLQGIWGPLIENWLDELLPSSCIESVQDRVTLLVTPVPSFGKSKISNFEDRNDLIKCNMASVHLPWFLDGKLTSNFRSQPHIDGSFLSKDEDYIPDNNINNSNFDSSSSSNNNNNIILDWTKDPYMSSKKNGMDFVEALSPEGIRGLMNQGKIYGKIMEDQGMFSSLMKKS